MGTDFAPGEGTPIGSLTNGVVTVATQSGGGFGVMVEIQHTVDDETVTSRYAHMLPGSIAVTVGSEVHAGTMIGKVGNTGASTGPHLHLEVLVRGTQIDPHAWLRAHAAS